MAKDAKDVQLLQLRIDPELKRAVKVRVAQLGPGWTISRVATIALRHFLSQQQPS